MAFSRATRDVTSAEITMAEKKVVAMSTPIVRAMNSRYPLDTLFSAYRNKSLDLSAFSALAEEILSYKQNDSNMILPISVDYS
jgi:hypothetical protein